MMMSLPKFWHENKIVNLIFEAQSSVSIFTDKYHGKCENTTYLFYPTKYVSSHLLR